MQFKVNEALPKPDTATFKNHNIRLFTAAISMDYTPQDTLKGGSWKLATVNDLHAFTAVGFFFGS